MPIHSPDLFTRAKVAVKNTTGLGYPAAEIRKAIAGGLAGAAPLFVVDVADFHLSRLEAGGLVGAFVLGVLAVFNIRNKPPVE